MIPANAIAQWYDLGISLDIDTAILAQIQGNVAPGNVVASCTAMLNAWRNKSGKTDELVHALEACDLMVCARDVKEGYSN